MLDILAGKNKDGKIDGSIYVNGNPIDPKHYKSIIGFVDQEDHLIPTLTVYETVLNSALLRLPSDMSFGQKQARVIEVLNELRILGIKDRVIGSDFKGVFLVVRKEESLLLVSWLLPLRFYFWMSLLPD